MKLKYPQTISNDQTHFKVIYFSKEKLLQIKTK